MSKVKYYYDSETLSYRKIEPKRGRKIAYGFLLVSAVILGTILLTSLIFIFDTSIETPREKSMKRELAYMKFQ